MLRIICRSNDEITFQDEASFKEICEAIKSNYSNILEIRTEYSENEEKVEKVCKNPDVDKIILTLEEINTINTIESIEENGNSENSEAVKIRNIETVQSCSEPQSSYETKKFRTPKTMERKEKSQENSRQQEITKNQKQNHNEPLLYHKDFTDSQYQFVEQYDLEKIRKIYQANESQDERLYDYLIMFGIDPDNVLSFNVFFAAVKLSSRERDIEVLVDKMMEKNWNGKIRTITPTAIKLILVHQYKQIEVIKNKKCNIKLHSLIKMLKIMIKEEIFI